MKNRISDNINRIILYLNLWPLPNLLGETIKLYEEGQWGPFNFPEQNSEPDDFDDSLFSQCRTGKRRHQ